MGCDRVIRKITSLDETVVVTRPPCSSTVDLSVPPAVGGLLSMTKVTQRTVAQGDGDEDIPCIDEATGTPFRPRYVHIIAGTLGQLQGSSGMGKLTDGNNVIVPGYCICGEPNTRLVLFRPDFIIFASSGAAGFVGTLVNSGVATTLRINWFALFGVGEVVDAIVRIEGNP